MLTKMPKVGDVLIAKDTPELRNMGDMTPGKEYVIISIDYKGEAVFLDDDGDARAMDKYRFARFNLKKGVMPKTVGYIEFDEEVHSSDGTSTVTLTVNTAGFQSLCALRDASMTERHKSTLLEKIAQCQAEMDHLNAMLAEVE